MGFFDKISFMRLAALTLIFVILLVPCGSRADNFDQRVIWRKIGSDLETATVSLEAGGIFTSELMLFRTALSRYRIGAIRAAEFGLNKATVKVLCQLSKAVLCINANFFDENGDPLGLVINRGTMHQKIHRGGQTLTGIFQVTRKSIGIVHRFEFNPATVIEAVQAGPRLISQGLPVAGVQDNDSFSRRSGICVDKNGRAIFFSVMSGLFGASLPQLQDILVIHGIDCKEVLNLDGGGSAQLYVSAAIPGASPDATEISYTGRDEVPVALGLLLNNPF